MLRPFVPGGGVSENQLWRVHNIDHSFGKHVLLIKREHVQPKRLKQESTSEWIRGFGRQTRG